MIVFIMVLVGDFLLEFRVLFERNCRTAKDAD